MIVWTAEDQLLHTAAQKTKCIVETTGKGRLIRGKEKCTKDTSLPVYHNLDFQNHKSRNSTPLPCTCTDLLSTVTDLIKAR